MSTQSTLRQAAGLIDEAIRVLMSDTTVATVYQKKIEGLHIDKDVLNQEANKVEEALIDLDKKTDVANTLGWDVQNAIEKSDTKAVVVHEDCNGAIVVQPLETS